MFESQTSSARLVKVRVIVALCDVVLSGSWCCKMIRQGVCQCGWVSCKPSSAVCCCHTADQAVKKRHPQRNLTSILDLLGKLNVGVLFVEMFVKIVDLTN